MKRALFVLTMLIVALPVAAQLTKRVATMEFASDFQTIPVMANVNGVGGAKFETYAAIYNPTSSAITIEAKLYDNAGNEHTASINLAAGELKTYENFVSDVFNVTGGGAVTLRSATGARFIVNNEIRTGLGNAYTTPIPSLEFAGSASRSYVAGVSTDASWRTNVGCFNQSGAANSIKATVLDKSGTMTLGSVTLNLAPHAWGQTAITTVVSDGLIRFEPSEAAVCYGVIVSNATNDGRFVSAVEYEP